MAKFAVIVPAAGKAERFGGEQKTVAKLDGRPIFIRSLELFVNRDDVAQRILAVSKADADMIRSKFGPNLAFMGVKLAIGGDRRCDSVAAALEMLDEDVAYVAVHDAVRPCATHDMIDAVFAEGEKTGAAILAAPVVGTLKRAGASKVIDETVARDDLYEAQTPQVFRKDIILDAYAKLDEASEQITDDAQLAELAGHAVSIVLSDRTNLKITTKADIALANAIVKSRPVRPKGPLGAFEEAQW